MIWAPGTSGSDDIQISAGSLVVTVDDTEKGRLDNLVGKLAVLGLGGNETFRVAPDVRVKAELADGDGNDTLP